MEDDEEDGVAGEGEGVDVDVDRGEGSGSGGSDDGEDEFEDDAANLQAFEEARQRQRKYAHVSGVVWALQFVLRARLIWQSSSNPMSASSSRSSWSTSCVTGISKLISDLA